MPTVDTRASRGSMTCFTPEKSPTKSAASTPYISSTISRPSKYHEGIASHSTKLPGLGGIAGVSGPHIRKSPRSDSSSSDESDTPPGTSTGFKRMVLEEPTSTFQLNSILNATTGDPQVEKFESNYHKLRAALNACIDASMSSKLQGLKQDQRTSQDAKRQKSTKATVNESIIVPALDHQVLPMPLSRRPHPWPRVLLRYTPPAKPPNQGRGKVKIETCRYA